MRHAWVNPALLALLTAQLVTGFLGLITGAESLRWVLWLHGVGGYALAALLIWKAAVVLDAFGRRRAPLARAGFVLLAALLLAILATGLAWTFLGRVLVAAYSLITVHVVLALVLPALLVWHVLFMRFIFRVPSALDRRALLRLGGATLAGLVLWQGSQRGMTVLALPGASRRFTGSYETGSFTGQLPVVSWLFDNPSPVDPATWRLAIGGTVERPFTLGLTEVGDLAGETRLATLDCTGGWYSTQEWTGVAVARLLDLAGVQRGARSVAFHSVSGYWRRFPLDEARGFLLATRIAGRPLDHGHGFPARLVAPGRRGFDWVKWVARIEVSEAHPLWQPPVPLQ